MSYSSNVKVIEKMKSLLDQMVQAKTDLTWPTTNAHMLGYHIREALTIAKKAGIKPYDTLKDRFVIRNRGDRVTAELKDKEAFTALQSVMSKVTLENLTSLMEIVGGAINHKAREMFFPDADLMPEELEKLHLWAEKNEYFMVASDAGVTLTRDDPGEAKWVPNG